MNKDTTLILLTLNEIEGLTALFDLIPFSEFPEHFAIDGGSSDGTVEFLREKGINVLFQEKKGRGEAFKMGVKSANTKFLIFFSPDGNEDPGDILRINEKLLSGFDLVIASRFMKGGFNEEDIHLFKPRAWMNNIFTLLANLLFNRRIYIHDAINGFRGIRRDAFIELGITAERFSVEYQMTIRAMKKGMKICEIPTFEGQRLGGESKAKSIPVGLEHIRTLIEEIRGGL